MKEYEDLMILDPDIGEEGVDRRMEQLKKLVEERNGKFIQADKWGLKKLAYPVKKKQQGYYVLVKMTADKMAWANLYSFRNHLTTYIHDFFTAWVKSTS